MAALKRQILYLHQAVVAARGAAFVEDSEVAVDQVRKTHGIHLPQIGVAGQASAAKVLWVALAVLSVLLLLATVWLEYQFVVAGACP